MSSICRLTENIAAVLLCGFIAACGSDTPPPDGIVVELAPDVISSNEGTIHVRSVVLEGTSARQGELVLLEVSYADRNGVDHVIESVTGESDERGAVEVIFDGFTFEGGGTIRATVLEGDQPLLDDEDSPLSAVASFSVLDLSPPSVTILPPTSDLVVGAGFPVQVAIEVADEIGISEVFFEVDGEVNRQRSTVVASGETSATVRFDFDVPRDALAGPTITLYALAADLSGNLMAAEPVVLTVDPSADIGVAAGLSGDLLGDGNNNFLEQPAAIAVSPMDGKLYVADNSGNSPCQGACIRVVDPATGAPESGALILGQGTIEGIAFDATGDALFYSDRNDRLVSLSWNSGAQTYDSPASCNDVGAGNPQDPYHLIFDATLGILVTDQQDQRVKVKGTCDTNDAQDFSDRIFDQPYGIAAGGTGEFYVSDEGTDRVHLMDDQGNLSVFESNFDRPMGIAWLSGGGSEFADSLLVSERDGQTVTSTQGSGKRAVVFLRNDPVDVAVAGDTVYVLTEPSAGDAGRIFVVTGL